MKLEMRLCEEIMITVNNDAIKEFLGDDNGIWKYWKVDWY